MIEEQFAASPAGGHYGEFPVGFFGFWMSNCHYGFNRPIPVEKSAPDSNRFGTHGHSTDGRTEVNASPYATVVATQCGRNHMPERLIVMRENVMGRLDQCVIVGG